VGRRRNDDLEGLIGPIAVLLFLFGAAIIAFLKALVLVALICGGLALVGFVIFRLGRRFWERQLDVEAYLPSIDWTLPSAATFDSTWVRLQYPEFPITTHAAADNVVGTSGAWKDVVRKLERFPTLRSASSPQELQQRVAASEAAAPTIVQRAVTDASELAKQKQPGLEQQIQRLQDVEQGLNARVRPKLNMLRDTVEALSSSGFFDRLRAERLNNYLSEYEAQLRSRNSEARERASRQEQTVRNFLDPAARERTIQERLKQDLTAMREVATSREFAGAAAEVAVIEELSALPAGCLVFNDVKMEAGRYIHFEGKPLMSAQIDTLVLTPTGVFVVEVKNWSREFAHSGEGFSPYEQASRASYSVFDRLRRAGMSVKVRAIIATNGNLPEKGDQKVSVVPIGRLRRYIEGAPPAQVDVAAVRRALGL